MRRSIAFLSMIFLFLAGCSTMQPNTPAVPTATFIPSLSPGTATLPATQTPRPSPEWTQSVPQVCSPLQGVKLAELAGWVVNPYDPPPQGSDDPHQGIDLADRNNPDGIALSGMPVRAVLAGKVAGFTIDRFPYGNMLMIESPLEVVLSAGLPTEALPTTLPELLEGGALSCPDPAILPSGEAELRSLYVLYAHLQSPPAFALGEEIQCGQEIGAIGNSGNALNPHLHLEVRVGPAGQTFDSMAHYDNSATPAEMAAYCAWRVSGLFQTVNPACMWGDCP